VCTAYAARLSSVLCTYVVNFVCVSIKVNCALKLINFFIYINSEVGFIHTLTGHYA